MKRSLPTDLREEVSEAELNALDEFLMSSSREDRAMDVSTLQGFLTAVAIGPRTVMPSEWMPWVWDMHDGAKSADFATLEEANQVMSLVMRYYNATVRQFMNDPAAFEPAYFLARHWGAAEWCEGFLLGTQFDQEVWGLLMVSEPRWFTPFMRLGTEEGMALIKQQRDGERWMNEVVPSLVKMYAYWQERRNAQPEGHTGSSFSLGANTPRQPVVREAPKVGRNDPCPCGSGKKFKKCCAVDAPTLH